MNKEPITFQELIVIIFMFTMILLFSSCDSYNKHQTQYNVCRKLLDNRSYQIINGMSTNSTDSLISHLCSVDSLK